MSMRPFDHDYIEDVIARLQTIHPKARPLWGEMTGREMIAHLTDALRYSMGRGSQLPDRSTWFTRNVLRRLLFWGVVRIPRNVRLPRATDERPVARERADVETLQAILEEYLALVQAGEMTPPPHPLLGPLDVDGWARMHMLHIDHHLRQFGA